MTVLLLLLFLLLHRNFFSGFNVKIEIKASVNPYLSLNYRNHVNRSFLILEIEITSESPFMKQRAIHDGRT